LAVHVVVAVHQDGHAAAHRADDRLDRPVHAGERERIGQVVEARPEKPPCGLDLAIAALHQNPGQGQRQMQGRRERAHFRLIRRRRDHPPKRQGGQRGHDSAA